MFAVVLDAPMLEVGMPADWSLDDALVFLDDSLDQRKIAFLDKLFHKVPGQNAMSLRRFRNNDQSRRVLIQPVNEARTNTSRNASINERAAVGPRAHGADS